MLVSQLVFVYFWICGLNEIFFKLIGKIVLRIDFQYVHICVGKILIVTKLAKKLLYQWPWNLNVNQVIRILLCLLHNSHKAIYNYKLTHYNSSVKKLLNNAILPDAKITSDGTKTTRWWYQNNYFLPNSFKQAKVVIRSSFYVQDFIRCKMFFL